MDSIETGQEQGGERQVRICRGIGCPKLNPFRFWIRRVGRNPNRRGTVPRGISEVDRRFESGHEPLVAVCGGIRQASERRRVPQNSTDEEERHLTQARVAVPSEKRFPIFPERHVGVHAGAVIAEERLGHEGDAFVVPLGHVSDDVLVVLQVIRHHFHRREANIDLRLTRGGDFMMLALDRDACLLHLQAHLVANVLQAVGRPDWEVAFFRANFVTEIWKFFPGAVPMPFRAVDEME